MAVRKKILARVLLAMVLFQLMAAGCVWQEVPGQPSPTAVAIISPSPTRTPLPDLAIEEVAIQMAEPLGGACERPEDVFVLRVVVSNRGDAPAEPFSLEINGEVQSVPDGLQSSEQISLSVPFRQERTIIHLDVLSQVHESAESNNTFSETIPVPALPPVCRQTPTPEATYLPPLHTLQGHSGRVMAAAFSPDGRLAASGSVDNTMRLWTADQGDPLRIMQGHTFPILCLDFVPNGSRLVTGSMDGILRVWQVSNSTLVAELKGHAGWVTSLDVSRDGQWLASGSEDFTVRLWRMSTYALAQTIDEGMAAIEAISFAPNSRSLAWAEEDGTVRVRTLQGEWLHRLRGAHVAATSLAYAPDGSWLAAGYANGSVYRWQVSDGVLAQVLKTEQEQATALAVSDDGSRLAAATDNGLIYVWSASSGGFASVPSAIFAGHEGRIYDIDFSPGGERLVSAGEDGTVRIWELARSEE